MRVLRAAVAALAGTVLLGGCSFDVYDFPLPGGPDVGDDPMTITVMFADVLDLVPKSTVKVNDVNVGVISDIDLDGFAAEVDITMRSDVDLPDNAVAEIRQTSLLGEKFVQLEPPASDPSSDALSDGDTIPLDRSGRNPEVEEVLGALSLILNGGGVGQLKTIVTELNKTLEGREPIARDTLTQVDRLTAQLDTNKAQIVDAIESLNRLAVAADAQLPSIDRALAELPSALDSLNRQRDDLKRVLRALNDLSGVAVGVIRRSKNVTIETLRQLQPVLTQLSNSGDNFVKAFNTFLTYPFVDEVVGRDPQVARNLHMGDYVNLSIRLNLGLDNLPSLPPVSLPSVTLPTQLPDLPGLPDLPDLPDLKEVCIPLDQLPDVGLPADLSELCKGALNQVQKCLNNPTVKNCQGLPEALITSVCRATSSPLKRLCRNVGDVTGALPDLGNLLDQLGLPALGGGSGGGGGGGNGGGGGGGGGGLLGDLLGNGNGRGGGGGLLGGGGGGGLLGGNRAGFGPTRDVQDSGGPTLGEMMDVYDPALTSLLVPGMVTR